MKILLTSIIVLLFTISTVKSQNSDAPSIFLDCQFNCDINYIKQEITFVNYSLERLEADIYIQITNLTTGGGGSQVQIAFQGNKQFASHSDTLQYFVDANATESIERDQMVRELKKGLLPYLLQTSIFDDITYSVAASEESENLVEKDPWNYWVFNIGGNGWMDGEQSNKNMSLNARTSVSKVTEENKFLMSSNYRFRESSFTLTDGEVITSGQKNYNLNLTYVKSISPNLSLGARGYGGSSTFGNRDFSASIKAAIEYNIYPYEDAQTKRFTFLYSVGPEYYDYTDTTIYNQITETLVKQNLRIEFSQTHKKGDLYVEIGASQFLHNFDLFSVYANPRISWQLIKGLSFNVGGYFSFINDRINIAKDDISDEDILLQIKQLDTHFSYFTNFGLNYRFGSDQNNFVNARF